MSTFEAITAPPDRAAVARAHRWSADRRGVERLVARVVKRAGVLTAEERRMIRRALAASPPFVPSGSAH